MTKDIKTLIEQYNEYVKQFGLNIPSFRTIDTNMDNVVVKDTYDKSGFNIALLE